MLPPGGRVGVFDGPEIEDKTGPSKILTLPTSRAGGYHSVTQEIPCKHLRQSSGT